MSDAAPKLPRVLFVDDEARVVESIAVNLRKEYQVFAATSGAEALRKLQSTPGICVVVSDMRMPGMDGATLLREIMHLQPDVARILLTGEAGRDAAAIAVNKGQILRFLTKPCPIETLKEALAAGMVHYRLARTERAVLQETLVGCIHALSDLLAISNPVAFGRASRIQRAAMAFATDLGMESYWQLECAAILSQIGYISLPDELVQKLFRSEPLTEAETERAKEAPNVAMRLLDHVPRLEPVIQILDAANWEDAALARLGEGTIGTGARILGLVQEYDVLSGRGFSREQVVQLLWAHEERYGKQLLEQYATHLGAGGLDGEVRILPVGRIKSGMIIMQDLYGHSGTLLASRGYQVTEAFCERIANFGDWVMTQPAHVLCPSPKANSHELAEV